MPKRRADYLEMVDLKIHGLSYREIADLYGLTQGCVAHRLEPDVAVQCALIVRAKKRCEECGKFLPGGRRSRRGETHHRREMVITRANYNVLEGLQYLCRHCHTMKHHWGNPRPLKQTPPTPTVSYTPTGFPATVNGHPVHCTEPPVTVAGLTWYYLKATEGKPHWQWCHETGQIV